MDEQRVAAMETEHAENVSYFFEMISGEAPATTVDGGIVTPRKQYKLVKSFEEAAAEGIRVISRFCGNGKREFAVRKSAAPNSNLSHAAQVGLYLDMMIARYKDLNARRKRGEKIPFGQNNLVYNSRVLQGHYGVSSNVVIRTKKDGDNGKLIERKRPGRKRQITDEQVELIAEEDEKANGTSARTMHDTWKEKGLPGYETRYAGKVCTTPSVSTLKRLKKDERVEVVSTVVTPLISASNAKSRLQFAKFHYDLFGDFHLLSTPDERIEFYRKMEQFCYVDETYIVYCTGLGRYLRVKQTRGGDCEVLGEEDQQLDGAQRKLVRDAFKSHQPKILLITYTRTCSTQPLAPRKDRAFAQSATERFASVAW